MCRLFRQSMRSQSVTAELREPLFRERVPPGERRDADGHQDHSVSAGSPTRWETSRRLGGLFGVVPRFDRIETLRRAELGSGCSFGGGCEPAPGSARGEGESPTVELVGLGGGEGQESNGLFGCLTVPDEERLLNRSKALESGS